MSEARNLRSIHPFPSPRRVRRCKALGVRFLVLLLPILCGAIGCASRIADKDRPAVPDDVLVADRAVVVEVQATDRQKGLAVPSMFRDLSDAELAELAVYRIGDDDLAPLPYEVSDRRIRGNFSTGQRLLIHAPLTTLTINKYDLFCRLQAVDVRLRDRLPDFSNRLCPVILCPSEPYFADRLLERFPSLREFPDQFREGDMRRMEIRPIVREIEQRTNICDQCLGLGRDFGDVRIPECVQVGPSRECWTAIGPRPTTRGQVENITNGEVVGAINAIALHPSDPDVAWVGGVNGGIWRTDDLTDTSPFWRQQTDFADSLSIGALELDPTDASSLTLWAGFGRTSSFGRRGGARAGLLRTTNGSSWTAVRGAMEGLQVSGLAPRGDTIVVGASAADTFADRGLWRSTDGGTTWTQLSGTAGSGLPGGASRDLIGDPSDFTRLYAHAGNGIFRSDDTGATWNRISGGAVDTALAGAGNVELAIGTGNNIYVAVVTGGRLSNLFRSGDGGASWSALDLPRTTENAGNTFGIHPGGQGNLHLSLAADRSDDNIVYIGGDRQPCSTEANNCRLTGVPRFPNSLNASNFTGRLFRVDASQPAGSQVAAITHVNTSSNSSPHADSRDMDVDANGDLIEGNDGGIYRRTAPDTNTGDWFSLNGNLQTTEFHNIAWDGNADVAIGGAQDTGTPEEIAAGATTWRSVLTADGGDVAVDDTGSVGVSVRYASTQFLGNFRRRTYNSGNTLQSTVSLVPGGTIQVTPGSNPIVAQFTTPVVVNNQNPSRLVMGAANSVYESTNQGSTWNEIAVGVVVNAGGSDPIAYGASGNANALYVGAGNQVLVRTTAAGTLAASAAYPGTLAVVDLAIDTGDASTAFAIDAGNVFMTDDAGVSWDDISGDLPDLEPGNFHSLAFATDPERIAVGTDVGVFVASGPEFDDWSRLGCDLPTVPVYDLDYDEDDEIWLAGTLGRGAWTFAD